MSSPFHREKNRKQKREEFSVSVGSLSFNNENREEGKGKKNPSCCKADLLLTSSLDQSRESRDLFEVP